jgi:hypothetical protein
VHSSLDFLQGLLDAGCFLTILVILELYESQFVHLLLDQHQDLVDLFDEVHFFDHLALLQLLEVHLLLDLSDFSLFVHLYLVRSVYLFCLPSLLSVEVQQKQFS